ncbi:MAG: DUF1549 domain-containing protein, partial [Planctomycetales bacterium]|nr:DUF1549 domain-containing protein [Planctomycetales bacterium]
MIKFSARNRERCAPVPRCAAARGEGAYHLTTSWLWLWLALGFVDSSLLAQEVQYNRDVRPILSDKCFACHGPDVATREADLRLDERASATEERGGYRVVSPGQVTASVLLERVTAADVSERMPPEGAFAAALTPEEVQTLRQWIAEGAEYQSHWSFSAPNRPPLPTVQNPRWAVNAIDRFVLAKLEPAGLQPAEAADGASLLRRVSLDLTGLPPTLAEIEDFEQACGQDPEAAYSAVVERLLHSPRHGEKMALHWLDAARYADTNGYFTDNERTMWPWRDWVIQAFNDNMPFDRFTIEQLAGDLLPQPTVAQRLATGFNRNHMLNNETGIIEEEFRVEYVADRVDTTSTVWMGLTVGCARCHDHKFDPISQRDYYRLFAFFNHVPESGLAGSAGNASPTMDVPAVALRQQLEQVRAALAEAQDTYAAGEAELEAAQSNWELTARDAAPSPPSDGLRLHCPLEDPSAKDPAAEEPAAEDPAAESPTSDDSTPESLTSESLTSESLESAGSVAGLAAPPAMTSGMVDFAAGMLGHGARFAGDGCLTLDPPFSPSAETPFTVGVWIQASGAGCVLSQMDDVHEMRGWDLTLRKGKAVF